MRAINWIFLTIIFLFLASCNLPVSSEPLATVSPESPSVDAVGTSVELTTVVRMTELAGSSVVSLTDTPASTPTETPTEIPSPTPCVPLVTASTIANIRSGPDTAYDAIGSLPAGGTAKITGRNDANTWWYIEFTGGNGGYAWIAGSVSTAACLPSSVPVVAAPPFPTSPPQTNTPESTEESSLPAPVAGMPDLVAGGMQYYPDPAKNNQPIAIQVKVTNNGTAPANQFKVVWLSNQSQAGCDWTVAGLGVGASQNLECNFTYNGNASATYWVTLIVDSGNQIAELNEGNNSREAQLKVQP